MDVKIRKKSKYRPTFVYAKNCGHWTTAWYIKRKIECFWEDILAYTDDDGTIRMDVYCAKCRKKIDEQEEQES